MRKLKARYGAVENTIKRVVTPRKQTNNKTHCILNSYKKKTWSRYRYVFTDMKTM